MQVLSQLSSISSQTAAQLVEIGITSLEAFEGVTEQNLPNIWMIGTFSGDLKSIVKDSNGTLNTENPIKIGTVKIALHGN